MTFRRSYWINLCDYESYYQRHLYKNVSWHDCTVHVSSLLMKAVVEEMGILEGRDGAMVLSLRLDLLRDNRYKQAGEFVKWSLQQGGPGLRCLSPAFYQLLANGGRQMVGDEVTAALNDIPDIDVQQEVTQVYMYLPLQPTRLGTAYRHGSVWF